MFHNLFSLTICGNHQSSITVTSRTSYPEPELYYPGLTSKYFFSKLTAELRRHAALQSLEKRTGCRTVICKRLSTIVKRYPGTGAQKFIMGGFIVIWEPTPAADI